MSEVKIAVSDAYADVRTRLADALFDERRSLHTIAFARVLLGLGVLGLLVTNFGSRGVWGGPGSAWVEQARSVSAFPEVRLLSGVSGDVFTIAYVIVLIAAFAFTIGWHTKLANAVLVFGFIAIIEQNPVTAAQADNLMRIALLWFLFIDAGAVWSADARRRGKGRAMRRSGNVLPDWFVTSMHNIGLLGLLVQMSLVYLSAGLHKVADPLWQNGSALGYTLRLPDYRAVAWLADLFISAALLTALLTYVVLIVQLYFVPLLINRRARILVILTSIVVNLVFALLFGQPWESLAIIAITILFLPDELVPRWLDAVRFSRVGRQTLDRVYTVTDRAVYGVYFPVIDAAKYRVWYPVTDWLRARVRR